MDHTVGIALIVFAVAVVAGLAVAGVRGLAAWRALKRFKGTAGDGMLATAAGIEQIEARTEIRNEGTFRRSKGIIGWARGSSPLLERRIPANPNW